MTDKATLADLLAKASGIHYKQDRNSLDPERQMAAARTLNEFGVLSVSAIASVVGCTDYRVEAAIRDQARSPARGGLNPQHLGWLGYMLSSGKSPANWVKAMVSEGTSISTIEDLTMISRSTLNRRVK